MGCVAEPVALHFPYDISSEWLLPILFFLTCFFSFFFWFYICAMQLSVTCGASRSRPPHSLVPSPLPTSLLSHPKRFHSLSFRVLYPLLFLFVFVFSSSYCLSLLCFFCGIVCAHIVHLAHSFAFSFSSPRLPLLCTTVHAQSPPLTPLFRLSSPDHNNQPSVALGRGRGRGRGRAAPPMRGRGRGRGRR